MRATARPMATLLTSGSVALLGATGGLLAVEALRDLDHVPADLDSAVAALAGLALGTVLLVWCAGSAAAVGAVLLGTTGTTGAALRAVADATTPLLLRRLIAAAVGAAVLGGASAPAFAGSRPAPAAAASASGLSWPSTSRTSSEPATTPSSSPTTTSAPAPATSTTAPATSAPAARPGTGPRAAEASNPQTPSSQTPNSQTSTAPSRTSQVPATGRTTTEVVVRSGDTLWSIAARNLPAGSTRAAVAAAWPRWYAANRAVIGSDPDHLRPGQRLVAP